MNADVELEYARAITLELVEAVDELLTNIYDAEDHLHPETGEQHDDITRVEQAIIKAKGALAPGER